MKSTITGVFLLLTLAIPARAAGEADRSFALRGLWYSKADPTKTCQIDYITVNPLLGTYYLVFTTERGNKYLGVNWSGNVLLVQNWAAVDGYVLATYSPDPLVSTNTIIKWDNTTFWSRTPNLAGGWYANGNVRSICQVQQPTLLQKADFVNSKAERATGAILGDTITIDVWGKKKVNLTGKIKGNRIEWSNGTYWTKK